MVKKIIPGFIFTAIVITGCASIVSKSTYPVIINSNPSQANVTITNSKGMEIFKGRTPTIISLNASDGFFKKASYQVKFIKEGYEESVVPINFKLDGWYFGNIVFGGVGLLGFLIVDPATGAMYKLETEFIHETLNRMPLSKNALNLKIYEIAEIPSHWNDHLFLLCE